MLQIRKWSMKDKYALTEIINNLKVQDNLRDGLPYPYTVADAENFISEMLAADMDKVFAFAIEADRQVVGSIAAYRYENIHQYTAELGYYIGEDWWGKGYATEAVRQICDFIFKTSDILRIFAEPFAHNRASCRVLEKAGFVKEGTLRSNAVKNGQIMDMQMYALVREKGING